MVAPELVSCRRAGYDATYDIFIDPSYAPTNRNSKYEIMIWAGSRRPNAPLADKYTSSGPVPYATNVNLDGRSFTLYLYHWIRRRLTMSYVDNANPGWFSGSLTPFFNDGVSRGWYNNNDYLTSVMAGWEFGKGSLFRVLVGSRRALMAGAMTVWAGSAEDAALDLAPVVLQRVVEVDGGGFGCRVRVSAPNRLVDRGVFLDRLFGMAADGAVQSDRAGLVLQAAGLPHRCDQERVVRCGGDAEVELVVAPVEQVGLAGQVALAAGFGGGLDGTQFRRRRAGRGEPARGRFLHPAELEEREQVVEVGGQEETTPPRGSEQALVVGDIEAPALLRPHPAEGREDFHRLPHDGAAGTEPGGELVFRRHPVVRPKPELRYELEDLLRNDLYPGR